MMKEHKQVFVNREDVIKVIGWFRNVDKEMPIMHQEVVLYDDPVEIGRFVEDWSETVADWRQADKEDKEGTVREINRLIDFVNSLIEIHNAPKVRVRLTCGDNKGNIYEIAKKYADILVELGFAEVVE